MFRDDNTESEYEVKSLNVQELESTMEERLGNFMI